MDGHLQDIFAFVHTAWQTARVLFELTRSFRNPTENAPTVTYNTTHGTRKRSCPEQHWWNGARNEAEAREAVRVEAYLGRARSAELAEEPDRRAMCGRGRGRRTWHWRVLRAVLENGGHFHAHVNARPMFESTPPKGVLAAVLSAVMAERRCHS